MERIKAPIGVTIDSREQLGWSLGNILADKTWVTKNAKKLNLDPTAQYLLDIPTKVAALPTADYCILDITQDPPRPLLKEIVVERKSPQDLIGALTGERDREERKIRRMHENHPIAFWIVECLEHEINDHAKFRNLDPKVISRTRISWSMKYFRVNWVFCDGRQRAATFCYRALEMYWKQMKAKPKGLPKGKPRNGLHPRKSPP